ncbi:MAG: hypothetical protein H8E60_07680 [Candidatus Marinimicrobia bacterium]|nr:hypothetical protein [Candidatus Neomarinimicrobiota bacterium]
MIANSLKLFLTKLIDYAGLFPPAKLQLKLALNNYNNDIKCLDKWMLSQFILPLSNLNNITEKMMDGFSQNFPLKLSLLSNDLDLDIDQLFLFKDKFGEKVEFSGLESKILDIHSFHTILEKTNEVQNKNQLNMASFFELPTQENWIDKMIKSIEIITEFNFNHNSNFGFKLRCGGVEPYMFPSPENIAETIIICIQNNISLKFTAGLHHPVRHYNDSIQTKMFGFFNIFIGGMLAKKYRFNHVELIEVLIDQSSNNFKFKEEGLSWKKYNLSNKEIIQFRENDFISYGSCSFNEPREDLTKLGIF